MAYLPPVVARLKFDLGDLDAKIEEAKAKIKSLGGESVEIKAKVDENGLRRAKSLFSDVEREMSRLSTIGNESDILGRKALDDYDAALGKLKKDLADAEAFHDNAVLIHAHIDDGTARAKLDELTRDRTVHVKVDVDQSMLSKLSGIGRSLLGPSLGSSVSGIPFIGGAAAKLPAAATGPAIGVLAVGFSALLNELTAVTSGFAAAGAGAAAFYVLAHPAINNLTQDIQGLDKANYNLGIAQNAYQLDPSKANLKALIKAQDTYSATLKQTQQDSGGAAASAMKLRDEYSKMTNAFQPEVFKVMNSGLKVLGDLMPHLTQFAKPFADSFTGLLNQFDKFARSKGFQDFMNQFSKLVGPSTTAIGNGIGQVAIAIGKLLTTMSGKDVAHGINILFGGLAGTINVITGMVKLGMQAWDGMYIAIHNVATAFDSIRHGAAGIGADFAHNFDTARHAVATAAHDIAHAFDNVRHEIAAKFDGVKNDIMSKFNGAGQWLADKAHEIANTFDHVRHDIAAKFDGIKAAIVSKFDGAPGWLVSIGKAILQGLINGLNSMLPGLSGVIGTVIGMVKSIGSALHIKSPSQVTYYYGQMITQGLALGMESGSPEVRRIANGLAGLISNPMRSAAAGGRTGAPAGWTDTPIVVQVHLDGREIATAVAQRSVQTQRRTGTNGMTKRTR